MSSSFVLTTTTPSPLIRSDTRRTGRRDVIRCLVLLVAIGGIASLHVVTDPSRVILHEIYNYVFYITVITAAYWYGVYGGIAAAALTSAAFIPHIRSAWADNAAYTASQYAQVLAFHVTGLTVGLLAGAQRRSTERYREAAATLEEANRELRHSHEHLHRADRLSSLGEIAAGLAHEIQNPLAGVKGALEIIASRVAHGTPEAEFADIGVKELGRLEGLVGEFLTYARPRDPALRPSDLHQVVERVGALLRSEADRKGVALVFERLVALPPVSLDPEQITQVVCNVVLNAIQATRAEGRVRIRESADTGWVIIDVIDEGPGVAPEHLSRLFDPFFTTKPRGTGLGLAISQRIVTAHRGTIEAMPGSPSGSIFRIRLPWS